MYCLGNNLRGYYHNLIRYYNTKVLVPCQAFCKDLYESYGEMFREFDLTLRTTLVLCCSGICQGSRRLKPALSYSNLKVAATY